MNIRQIAELNPRYSQINREERNYAAIFYHAIMNKANAQRFLRKLGIDQFLGEDFGIYFEYSMLRDLWAEISDDDTRRKIIKQKLDISHIHEIMEMPCFEINKYFGVVGEPSKDQIQYPGKWAITKYNKNISNDKDFEKVCKFKWSFNIKPDIVIHLDKDQAVCIEAKYESGEGKYPSQEKDKEIFESRNIPNIGQMELQKYMMEDLLGIKTEFVFLVFKKEKSDTHKIITWAEAFEGLDLKLPEFAEDMLKNLGV